MFFIFSFPQLLHKNQVALPSSLFCSSIHFFTWRLVDIQTNSNFFADVSGTHRKKYRTCSGCVIPAFFPDGNMGLPSPALSRYSVLHICMKQNRSNYTMYFGKHCGKKRVCRVIMILLSITNHLQYEYIIVVSQRQFQKDTLLSF